MQETQKIHPQIGVNTLSPEHVKIHHCESRKDGVKFGWMEIFLVAYLNLKSIELLFYFFLEMVVFMIRADLKIDGGQTSWAGSSKE